MIPPPDNLGAWVLRTRGGAYAVAVVVTSGALALRLALLGWTGQRPLLILFLIPIIISAYIGGLRAGLLSTLIAGIGSLYFLLPPFNSFALESWVEAGHWLALLAIGVLISLLSERLHRMHRSARATTEEHRLALARLREHDERIRAIVQSSEDAIIGKGLDGTITNWSRGAEAMFGYADAEIVGRSVFLLDPPEKEEEEREILARIARGETVHRMETTRVRKDGTPIEVSITVSPIRSARGEILGAATILRDMSDRIRSERVLRESEDRLRMVIDTLSEGLVMSDMEGRLLYWNRAALSLHGFSQADEMLMVLASFREMYEMRTLEGVLVPFDSWPLPRILRGEDVRNLDLRISRLDCDWQRVFSYSGAVVEGVGGGRTAFLTMIDITDRSQTETLLTLQQDHAQSLLRLSRSLESAIHYSDILRTAQEEVRRTLGLSALWIYLFSNDRKSLRLLAADERSEELFTRGDARILPIEGNPLLEEVANARRSVVVVDALADDRTNKTMVARLRSRTIINVPIALTDRRLGVLGTGTFGDEGVRHLTPLEEEFLTALASHVAAALARLLTLHERRTAERRLALQAAVSQVLAEAVSLNEAAPPILEALCNAENSDFGSMWLLDADAGVLRSVDSWYRPEIPAEELAAVTRAFTFARGEGLPGTVWQLGETISVSKEAFDARCLRASAAKPLGLSSAVVFPIMLDGNVIGAVDIMARKGSTPDARLLETFGALGRQIGAFVQRRRAEAALRQSEARFATAFRSNPTPMTLTRVSDDCFVEANDAFIEMIGRSREELIGRSPSQLGMTSANVRTELLRRVREEGSVRGEEIGVRTGSGTMRQVLVSMETVELDGEPHNLAIMMDVTHRRSLEAQLQQAQKMEAIGQLAGGVAHDFNNLLTVIIGASELLAATLAKEDPSRELVEEIRAAGNRASSLTSQLLAFSRQQVLEPRVVDLNAVVADTEKMLRRLLGEDIALNVALNAPGTSVRVDPGRLAQVIINLAVNARDAMPTGGHLTVETQEVELDSTYTTAQPSVAPGRYALLAITDTGSGMSADVKARLFEPFFTTKGMGRGTGLGLSVVHGIVAQSGGRIEVYSEPGFGTTFKIYFPVYEKARSASAASSAVDGAGLETILVVEDEEDVRRIAVRGLRTNGYNVLEATNGLRALEVLEQHGGRVDLIVTDVVMPSMSGRELAEAVRMRYPQLKVLFTSGYTDDAVVRHGILAADVEFLQKPYTPSVLVRKVRETLDR
ncbi:MAG TPA: PAS domain S-box protein [Candidatus Kapabacteria bacterium]|nr:PAS domain S-box protein [Candidatus Kapabacteria bacterium]